MALHCYEKLLFCLLWATLQAGQGEWGFRPHLPQEITAADKALTEGTYQLVDFLVALQGCNV